MLIRMFSIVLLVAFAIPARAGGPRQYKPLLKIALPGCPTDMALAPNGKTAAVAVTEGPASTWDISTGKKVREFEDMDKGEFGRVAISPDGTLLAAGGKLGVKIWDIETGKMKHKFRSKQGNSFDQLIFSPGGKSLVLVGGGFGGPTIIWNFVANRGIEISPKPGDGEPLSAAFSPDGQTLYYVERIRRAFYSGIPGRQTVTMTYFSLKSRKIKTGKVKVIIPSPKFEFQVPIASGGGGARLALSPDGKTLLYGTATVDLAKGVMQKALDRDGCGLTFSPDGQTLAANNGPFVSLYDYKSGKKLMFLAPIITSAVGFYVAPAFTPDLHKIVVPGGDNCLWVWDVAKLMKDRGAK
jgi:WD40 repeat protein